MSQTPDLMIRRADPENADLLAEWGARTFCAMFAADNSPPRSPQLITTAGELLLLLLQHRVYFGGCFAA